MKHVAGLSLAFVLTLAGPGLAQEGGMRGGMGNRPPMQDHWITADSLVKSLGITDAKIKDAVAPHLAEVDKILKTVADERKAMMQGGGGMPSDSVRQAMMAKNAENQKSLDAHLGAVREGLPEANRAAFDALQKPSLRMGGRRGGMGGTPPGQ